MSKFFKSAAMVMLLFLMAVINVCANEADPAQVQFSLITCGPGKRIYELEGHTAIRMKTPDSDLVVNWGTFDETEDNFVYNFVAGKTDYWCSVTDYNQFLNAYQNSGRWVMQQNLDLTPEQAQRLQELINENLKPENRRYRYKYLSDNCATRPLALIEEAIGHELRFDDEPTDFGTRTYREMLTNYHAEYPWYQFGIDLVLGRDIDKKLTQREKAFSPLYLRELMERTYYVDSDGERHYPVSGSTVIRSNVPPTNEPITFPLTPTAAGWILFIITIFLSAYDIGRKVTTRWFDAVMYTVYGLAGTVVAYLVLFSDHEATTANTLILWLNPFCLIVPILIYVRKCRKIIWWYDLLNVIATFAMLVILWGPHLREINQAAYPFIYADLTRSLSYMIVNKSGLNGRKKRK